ncbi:hypothetical protein P154DRAFT_528109 [Amniculicola lignicola CBS 123094]|uniref:Uncharacterized protein n=1 Tax=Amniculicola lignicola CBS 123094 TaxID=1392246 RepID=A0A6A5VUB6_9PLEO|nr:hypothetical protein P154DRAFT_528109 [Amniculicola lignicola CBS 123094]
MHASKSLILTFAFLASAASTPTPQLQDVDWSKVDYGRREAAPTAALVPILVACGENLDWLKVDWGRRGAAPTAVPSPNTAV